MRIYLLLSSLMLVSTSYAKPPATTVMQPTIVNLAGAPERQVPSGKARVKMLAQGQKAFVGQLWLAPEARVPVHRDTSEEYIFIVSGAGEMTINGQTSQVGPGTMVFMPANAEVSFKNGPEPLRALQIFAGPESAAKYAKWQASTPGVEAP